MNCTKRCVVFNMDCKPENRCSLDSDMKVNARMCCEEWSDKVVIRVAAMERCSKRRDVQSLIQM